MSTFYGYFISFLVGQQGERADGSGTPPPVTGPDGTPAGGGGFGFDWPMIAIIGVMILVFWFLIIRPQRKQQKELKAKVASVRKGDRILTGAGFHMSVTRVKENSVMATIGESREKGVVVEIGKAFIQNVFRDEIDDDDDDEDEAEVDNTQDKGPGTLKKKKSEPK
jgi:preprotein translocase subunit YajC